MSLHSVSNGLLHGVYTEFIEVLAMITFSRPLNERVENLTNPIRFCQ